MKADNIKILKIGIITGEASGDQLGADFLRSLRESGIEYKAFGVGGELMLREGFHTLFPQEDIAVMGLSAVIMRLPLLLRRINQTANFFLREKPDVVLTIDAPDFCKRVTKKIREKAAKIPIIHCVCPSVWAWRPKRAKAMQGLFDKVLCLLPFEPQVLEKLQGPPGFYVGHPLIEKIDKLLPQNEEDKEQREKIDGAEILLLPGSRKSEIERHIPLFIEVIKLFSASMPNIKWVIPTFPHFSTMIREKLHSSNIEAEIIIDLEEKYRAMRRAKMALAASGTVTLELALARIPMITTYRVAAWEAMIMRRLVKLPSVILPNLILEENVIPEFLQEVATPENISKAMINLFTIKEEANKQQHAFIKLYGNMQLEGKSSSARVLEHVLNCTEINAN